VRYLTAEQILLIHSLVLEETGGSHGIRDRHAVLSLEGLPRQTFGGKELYPTIFLKAALYARNIIMSHPFIDGNKRTAMTAASVFLENNEQKITAYEGAVEEFALRIIHEKLDLAVIAGWFKKNSKEI